MLCGAVSFSRTDQRVPSGICLKTRAQVRRKLIDSICERQFAKAFFSLASRSHAIAARAVQERGSEEISLASSKNAPACYRGMLLTLLRRRKKTTTTLSAKTMQIDSKASVCEAVG